MHEHNVWEHMRDTHEKQAAHHLSLGAWHTKRAVANREVDDHEAAQEHIEAAHDHKAMHEHHKEAAAHCKGMAASAKAAGDSLNKLVPDGVRSVIPSDVPASGFRAVPRAGQPEIKMPEPLVNLTDIDPTFHDFLKLNE